MTLLHHDGEQVLRAHVRNIDYKAGSCPALPSRINMFIAGSKSSISTLQLKFV